MRLRAGILPLFLGHLLTAIFGVAFVSVSTFFAQVLYIGILYSIYMALHTWLIWVYFCCVGLNVVAGFFKVWFYEGSMFYAYFFIIMFYLFALFKLYMDSRPWRGIGDPEGEDFYFGAGIRHILDHAK
jgi:hypothetical protein